MLVAFLSISRTIDAANFTFEGFEFTVTDDHAELAKYTGSDTKVNIPEYVNY